jgi:hypothetical protein
MFMNMFHHFFPHKNWHVGRMPHFAQGVKAKSTAEFQALVADMLKAGRRTAAFLDTLGEQKDVENPWFHTVS